LEITEKLYGWNFGFIKIELNFVLLVISRKIIFIYLFLLYKFLKFIY
jgi:hypothetical protein